MTTALFDTPPRDPLADAPLVTPGPQHLEPAFSLAELDRFPFVNAPLHDAVLSDAASALPEPIAETVWSAASVTRVAVRLLRETAEKLRAIDDDDALSPIGRMQRAIPIIDAARAGLHRELRRVADAGELQRAIRRRAATPKGGPAPDTAREIRAAIATLSRDERENFIAEVANRALNGDRDARETVLALLSAPAAWRELNLTGAFRASMPTIAAALEPDVAHAVAWLEWAISTAETAARDAGQWLDSRRSQFAAPPTAATVVLPANAR